MNQEDYDSKIQPDLQGEDYLTFCGLNRVAEDVGHLVQADVTVSVVPLSRFRIALTVKSSSLSLSSSLGSNYKVHFKAKNSFLSSTFAHK